MNSQERNWRRWLPLIAGLFALVAAVPTQAHNGAVAIAVPVVGITIDGDLSDWPEDMTRYPIQRFEYGVDRSRHVCPVSRGR